MTPEKFNRYLNDPSLLDSHTVEELWMLVKDYPYFQVARMLLARNLYNTGHEAYPLSLRLAAAYAGDRGKLKALIEGIPVILHEVPEKESIADPFSVKEEADGSNIVSSDTSEIKSSETELAKDKNEIQHETEMFVEQHIIETVSVENHDIRIETDEIIADDPIVLAVSPEGEIVEEVIAIKSNDKTNTIHNALIDTIFSRLSAVPVPEEEITDFEPANFETEVFPALNKNLSVHNDLVEKFIREEPRISSPKREFYNAEDIAKQSATLPEDLVTETLAWIYEQQGYYNLAIKIYEKLMLLIPEKSSYFAGRIKEITKKPK
jgi:tetratricopeptide (TPR) repeat protein